MFVDETGPSGLEFRIILSPKTWQFIDIEGRTSTATTERRQIEVLLREAFQERPLANMNASNVGTRQTYNKKSLPKNILEILEINMFHFCIWLE